MEIEGTTFGTITIDGKSYEHDVIIRLSGEVVKRKKKLSKKYYGTSHVLSMDEAKFIFERGCEQLILGSGQIGNVHLSPEAEVYFAKKGCKVLLQPTPEAIGVFNRSHPNKIGLFLVACAAGGAGGGVGGGGTRPGVGGVACPRPGGGRWGGHPKTAVVVKLENEQNPIPPVLVDGGAPRRMGGPPTPPPRR